MEKGQGESGAGLEWAISVVEWADERGLDLSDSAELFPYVQLVLWARTLRRPPTNDVIRARWGVHRASAQRWRRRLHQVWAKAHPRHESDGGEWTEAELAAMAQQTSRIDSRAYISITGAPV